jgi:hypothetical protein
MATARQYHHQMIHFLRKTVGFADDGTELAVGTIPAGSVIIKPMSGVQVSTAFDAGTTNTLNIGTDADDNLFMTLGALGTATFVPMDEAIGGYLVAADTNVTATVVLTGTAATAGSGEVIIAYVPDTDG